jgi:hypothetical protein
MIDFSLSLLFAADAVRRIAASPLPPLQAALQPSNLLDLLSSAPALLEPAIAALAAALSSGTSAAPALAAASAAGGLRWLRVFRALRLLRLAMLSANLPRMRTSRGALLLGAYNVPLLSLIASVGALAATGAALVSAVERMPLHDALYFVLSSLSTIGFGDIVARTLPGRAVVLALMVCALVLVPARVQQLAQQMARRPVAAGPLPSSRGRRPFVVLSASRLSDVRGFEDLLAGVGAMARREAAREARRRQRRRRREASGEGGDNNDDDDADATPQPLAPLLAERDPHVVALASTPPGPEFLALQEIAESRGRRLTLLQGSVFSADDLARAALERAEAVVVAADRFASSSSRGGSGAGSASAASAAAAAMFGGGPHHQSPGIDRPGTPSSSSSSSSNGAAAPSMLFAAPPLPSGAITGNEDADEAEEDVEALFRVWALKAYTETTPLRVQVLREGAARRVAPFLDPRRDVVVSVEHTRLRLLALAALCPGASTLVANLLRPATRDEWGDAAAGAGGAGAALGDDDDDERTDDDEEEDNQEREQNEQQKQRRRASFAGRAWLREYADGCRADVLPLKAGAHLRGATFAAAAEAVATATRGRVVPLGTVDVRRQRVRLNPSPRLLRAGDELLCACRGGDRLAEAAVEGPRGAASTTTAAVKRALGLGRERAAAVAASLVAAAAAGTQEDASPSRQPPPTPTTRAEQAAALEELVRRGHPCLTGWAAPGSSSMAGASLDWGGGNGGLGLGTTAGVRPSSALGIGGAAAVASSDSSAGEEEEDEEEEGAAAAAGGDGDQDDETCSVESLQELAEEVRAIVEKQQLQRQKRQLEAAAAAAAAASAAAGAPSHPAAANPAASATPRRPPTKPSSRHFILCGHADSFLPFARQLVRSLPRPAGGGAASSPAPQRLSLVVVHPDATPEGAAALERALRVTIATDAAASAAEVARRARRRADVGGGGSGRGQREEQAAAAAAVAAAAAAAVVAAASSSPLSDDNNNNNQHLLPPPAVHVSVRAVAGKPMDKAALEAAGARRRGAALVFVGPRDRRQPSGGSSSDPGPSSSSEAAYGSLSRAAVQADADALLTAYGVGEPRSGGGGGAAGRRRWEGLLLSWLPGAVAAAAAASAASASGSSAAVRPLSPPPPSELPLPESLHAVVELSFTSSVRLLQPGLLLHGGPAAGGGGEGVAATTTRPSTPSSAGKQPRASWRDRRAAESDARGEGLAEWQVSAYYAAGRALVPAAVDTLVSVQPLYRGFRLPALLEALCGDAPGGAAASTAAPSVAGGGGGGVGGGSPLAQRRVPRAFVGRTWGELAQAMLVLGDAAFAGGGGGDDDEEQEQWQQSGGDGGAACLVPLGLLRPKVESPSWRLPFVSALPEAETRLDARDVAFFLRPGG